MQTMIVPLTPNLVRGFHAALDSVAREGRYLAMIEAPRSTPLGASCATA
jgi:hypothetical protein